jgi:hypothetical protein
VAENDYPQGKFNISQSNPSISKSAQPKFGKSMMEGSDDLKKETIELVKYLYRKSEDFSPYWEQHGLTYDDICDALEAKKMIINKNGKCELSKSLGTPEQALQALEAELRNLVGGETSQGPELETENYPLGAKDDPRAPYNQIDPRFSRPTKPKSEPLKVIGYNNEIAILKGVDGSHYVFYYTDISDKDLADGDPDFEYGDFEIDGDVLQGYVNDNLKFLSKGEGVDAADSGVDLVKIDSALKQELMSMYDKDRQIVNSLGSIQETSDGFEKSFEPTKKSFVKSPDYKAPAKDAISASLQDKRRAEIERRKKEANRPTGEIEEMTSTTSVSPGYETAFGAINKREMPVDTNKLDVPVVYENVDDKSYTHYALDKADNKIVTGWDYSSLFDEYERAYDNQSIREYTKMDLIDMFPEKKPSEFKVVTRKWLLSKGVNPSDINSWYRTGLNETLTASGAGNYAYDANALPGINRDGSFKQPKQTKAEKNTQWAGGAFVDFNDCTKLNNKPAGAGCSQGAVDNIVKLKKTSGNINAPSLSKGKQ